MLRIPFGKLPRRRDPSARAAREGSIPAPASGRGYPTAIARNARAACRTGVGEGASATGTTRPQIRRLITTEAALLAAIGGGLGVLAGTALGAAGTLAILSDGGIEVAVPWLPLAGLLAVTLLVGVAASLRPAGRAAAVAPVTALAAD